MPSGLRGSLRISPGLDDQVFSPDFHVPRGSISAPFTMAEHWRKKSDSFSGNHRIIFSKEEIVFWEGIFRRKLAKNLEQSRFGQLLDLISVATSLFSVVIYVMQTYEEDNPKWYSVAELSYSIFFLCEFLLRWYASSFSWKFCLDWSSIIDVLTTIPILLEGLTHYYLNLSFLRLARILKSLRIMRIHKLVQHTDSEVQRQLFTIIFLVVSSVFTIAGLLHLAENEWRLDVDGDETEETPKKFHDALYLTVVTMSTIGYGDFHPTTLFGKLVVMIGIFFTIVMIPQQMNRLVGLLSLKSVYARASYFAHDAHPHIIVCGSVTYRGILDFLKEFLHEDHGNADMNVVILSPEHPTDEMLGLLRTTKYKQNLVYIEGSCLQNKDLKRCDLSKAKACFVLSNQYCANPDEEDSSNIIRALAVKRFVRAIKGDVQVILQIIRPENKLHFIASMQQSEIDQIVCINEIKMSMLGQSALCPGFSTLIGNLIQSSDSVPPEDASSEMWQYEYCHGCGYEFYRTPLSKSFEGRTFREVVDIIYTKFECVAFALEVIDTDNKRKIAVAPVDLIVGERSRVYVLAPDSEVASMISNYKDYSKTAKPGQGTEMTDPLAAAAGQAEVYKEYQNKMRKLRRASLMSGDSVQKINNNERRGSHLWKNSQGKKSPGQTNKTISEEEDKAAAEEAGESEIALAKEKAEHAQNIGDGETPAEEAEDKKPKTKFGGVLAKAVGGTRENLQSKLMAAIKLNKSYHVQKPVSIRDATIKNCSHLSDHIIICGPRKSTPSGLFHLLAPLRRSHLTKVRPIVLMMPYTPERKSWEKVSHLQELYYMEGSPHQYSDLLKANISKAFSTIILTATYNLSKNEGDLISLIDADSIFSYQHIKRMADLDKNENAIIVELVSAPNMAFLEQKLQWTSSESYMAPCFASGRTYTASLLDTLVCQTYYNRDLLTIIRVLVCGGGALDEITTRDSTTRKQGFISQICVPENAYGYRYVDFFKYLLYQHDMICLALYRAPFHSGNLTSYVYTNPFSDAEVGPGDRAFVICNKEPGDEFKKTKQDGFHSITRKKKPVGRMLNLDKKEPIEENHADNEFSLNNEDGESNPPEDWGKPMDFRTAHRDSIPALTTIASLKDEINSLKDDIRFIAQSLAQNKSGTAADASNENAS